MINGWTDIMLETQLAMIKMTVAKCMTNVLGAFRRNPLTGFAVRIMLRSQIYEVVMKLEDKKCGN
jgi:hypothetical protein